jgi:hypothetical protein
VAHYRRTRAAFAHLLLVGELVSGHGQAAPEQHRAPRREQSLRELHLPALRALVAPLRGCSRKRRQLAARAHRGCCCPSALARKSYQYAIDEPPCGRDRSKAPPLLREIEKKCPLAACGFTSGSNGSVGRDRSRAARRPPRRQRRAHRREPLVAHAKGTDRTGPPGLRCCCSSR